jgi:RNA recognition motif-containing protein
MKKILVDGLPWAATEEELVALFQPYGKVEAAVVIRDPVTRQSRGFGFVEMPAACAEQAVMAVNGQEFLSNRLFASMAKERPAGI